MSTKRGKESKQPKESVEKPLGSINDELRASVENLRNQLEEATRRAEQSDRKAADYFDRLQRMQADMENLQKITKRQVDTVTKQASEGVLLKLLPILDALQQAANIAHSDSQLPKEEMAVGLQLLLRQLTEVLRSEGLEEVPSVGQQMDPSKHEAVNFTEKDDMSENTITEEVRKGYMLNGRVIRPSLVVVSKHSNRKEKDAESGEEQ